MASSHALMADLQRQMGEIDLDDSGVADEPNPFLDPKISIQPKAIDIHSDVTEYLIRVRQNIQAEYAGFLKNTTPKVLSLDINANGHVVTVRELDTSFTGENLEQFSRHLFVVEGRMHRSIYFQEGDSSFLGFAKGAKWTADTNRNFEDLQRRPCNVGKAFDFGYIGEFESEYFACEELSTRPHSSLLTSVADPQQRIEVVESFEPMPSYESVARGAVPINETQYDIIAGLHRSIECVQGPPGTGKSTTIFHIINSRLPEGTVALATCVQNKAVDAIADKLEDRVPFFVYGREDRLGLVSKRNTISGQIERHPEVVTLTRLINNVRRFQQEVVNEAKKRLKESADKLYSDKRSRQRQVRANAKYPHGSLDYQEKRDTFMARDMWKFAWEKILARRHGTLFTTAKRLFEIENHAACLRSRLKSELRETIVGSARAILCTVASTGSLIHCEELFAATSRITTAVLDEAGTSPEAKLPVLLLNPCLDKIIAIGDQQQLAPFTHLDDPVKNVCFQFQKHGFCSYGNFCKFMHGSGEPLPDGFFQRAEKSLGSIPILTEQYRMHPDICQVVSTLFYDNQLTTNPLVSVRRRHASARGLFWSQSNSFESKAPNSSSTQNLGEAKQVLKVYNQVAKSMAPDQTIMVITFYKAQLHALKDEFRSNMIEETPALRLVTVDQSQGSEADFVILSTVRSGRSIGFLSNCNRLNVAISRAREQLICVGNKLTLMTSPEWNKVIQACHPFEL